MEFLSDPDQSKIQLALSQKYLVRHTGPWVGRKIEEGWTTCNPRPYEKEGVAFIPAKGGGGDYTPYIPGSDGPETRKKYTVHSVGTIMM